MDGQSRLAEERSVFVFFLVDERVVRDIRENLIQTLAGNRDHSGVLRIRSPLRPKWGVRCGLRADDKSDRNDRGRVLSDRSGYGDVSDVSSRRKCSDDGEYLQSLRSNTAGRRDAKPRRSVGCSSKIENAGASVGHANGHGRRICFAALNGNEWDGVRRDDQYRSGLGHVVVSATTASCEQGSKSAEDCHQIDDC